MSSRNKLLNPKHRAMAPIIYQTLQKALALKEKYSPTQIESWIIDFFKLHPEFELEYFTIADTESLQKISVAKWHKKQSFYSSQIG